MRHDHGPGGRHHRLAPVRLHRRSSQLSPNPRLGAQLASATSAFVVVLVVLVGLAGSARADVPNDGAEAVEAIRLVYQGHDGCPDAEAFRSGVVSRTSRATFVDEEEAARALEVSLSVRVGGTKGRLVITDVQTGQESRREVSGDDCAIVVDALALVAALAIDPAARLTPQREEPEPIEPASPVEPTKPTPPDAPSPQPILGPPPAERRHQPDDGVEPTVTEPAVWRPTFAAQVQGASGVGRLAPVFGGLFDIALDRQDWLSPSFRALLFWMPPIDIEGTSGGGSFWRWGGQASVCPIGPRPAPFVVLRPCVGFELGALKAEGVGLDENNASSTAWASVSAAARTQLYPTHWMLVELQAELGVPLIRPRYLVEPDATVVQVAPVFGAFGSAVGVRLP